VTELNKSYKSIYRSARRIDMDRFYDDLVEIKENIRKVLRKDKISEDDREFLKEQIERLVDIADEIERMAPTMVWRAKEKLKEFV